MELIKYLEEAIAEENSAVEKYRKCAQLAEDPETRLMFEQLAREEEQHGKRLRERLKAIKLLHSF
jgi:rubrerythrin